GPRHRRKDLQGIRRKDQDRLPGEPGAGGDADRASGHQVQPMTTLALLGGAHIHTPGFIKAIAKRSGEVKVKSVWDHDADRARKRAGDLVAHVVADPKQILDDADVTAVVICSETDRHEQLVLPAAAA